MHLYTFITEYKGGTYIIQIKASHIKEATRKWADEVFLENIPGLDRDAFLSAFKERMSEFGLSKIDETKNVWYLHFFSGRNRMEVHAVKTLPADEEEHNLSLSEISSMPATTSP